jgi:hypothetical protein
MCPDMTVHLQQKTLQHITSLAETMFQKYTNLAGSSCSCP